MTKKHESEWVVRFCFDTEPEKDIGRFDVLKNNPNMKAFIECLRYAGLVHVFETDLHLYVDLECPKGLESKSWADQNVERINTFGFTIAAAAQKMILPYDN